LLDVKLARFKADLVQLDAVSRIFRVGIVSFLVVLKGRIEVLKSLCFARLAIIGAAFRTPGRNQAASHTQDYIPPAAHFFSVASTQDCCESSIGLVPQQQPTRWMSCIQTPPVVIVEGCGHTRQ